MRNPFPVIGVGLLIGAACGEPAGTSDWPQFRGPTGQGVSEAKGLPRSWGLEKGVAWSRKVPGGWASPVLVGGKVFLSGAEVEDGKTTLCVMQLDAKSGRLLWRHDIFKPEEELAKQRHAKNGLASPTPLIADGVIYVHFGHMGTAALKAGSGEVIWKRRIDYPPMHGNASSPVLVDGKLILNVDAEEDPAIMALAGNFSSSPVLAAETLYCCTEDGVCYVVDVSKKGAKVVSEVDMKERIFASPVVVDGAVYLRGEEHLWKIASSS